MVLVDRDQKDVKMLEDGDREMATMIECLSADGTCIHSNVIFKANRQDHSWGANNPGNASISLSPKGWTDQELGFKWLQRDFDPVTWAKLKSDDEY
ncbi:hypothetical protein D9758_015664 [Tetrapyrgos nigripes]|uniref:DDE-1 domain-containing protein n=1 Tax=Tetrapyrgos nigripes TaxID=182062 RepID=A0A8H5FGT5_9AGAR|nr:hypothetical protein D9758_015664 [Tetrapyrgos nigripes]